MSDRDRAFCIRIYRNDVEETYALSKQRYEIGSHVDADIRDADFLFMHAEITFEQGSWVIRKKNPYASIKFCENEIVLKRLNDGDVIEINGRSLLFSAQNNIAVTEETVLAQESNLMGLYMVRVMNGGDKGREFTLRASEYLIGRRSNGKGRRIEINDEYLSRDHARVTATPDYLLIEDLNSQNGTRYRMRRISREFLSPPCNLIVGRTKIRFTRIPNRSPSERQTIKTRDGLWSPVLTTIFRNLRKKAKVMHV